MSKAVTDDFIESFKDTTDFSGPFFRMILMGVDDEIMRPIGLDYDDPRVKEIISKIKEANHGND